MNSSDPDYQALQQALAGTFATTHLDTLGRPVLAIQENDSAQYEMRITYDVEGNVLEVEDARGNTAVTDTYGPGGTLLKHDSNDAGTRWVMPDVMGQPCRAWDGPSHAVVVDYDDLRRPTKVTVT